jgi:two-component system, cell cycle sensor histidine kinase and response regulator CckA
MRQDDPAAPPENGSPPSGEEALQSQKMEAVGRLAGGVAHDFNNILTAIQCYARFLFDSLPEGDKRRDDANEIAQACRRGAALTRQLLAFSRRQVMAPVVLDLNASVRNMEKMLKRLLPENVRLLTKLEDGAGNVRMDPNQLEQVIMNLVVNARDAMPQGGAVTVETAWAAEDGRQVALKVIDTGTGMDPETVKRIFEPFFTTKGREHGTGLGLATVYGIVKQSGGEVRVSSQPGRGSAFSVLLPRVLSGPEESSSSTKPSAAKGKETVLLVEDEPGVRALTRRSLEGFGYKVLEAVSAEHALLSVGQSKDTIHLLLTDIVMTGMSGPDLARRLSPRLPGLKSLFMSGYNDDVISQNGLLPEGSHFLQKPFSPEDLAAKVREALDRR